MAVSAGGVWRGRRRRSDWVSLAPPRPLERELRGAAARARCELAGLRTAKVKSYAPGVTHLVARMDLG